MFKLVLGTIFGRPYPWLYGIRIRAVMVNAYEILRRNILDKLRGENLRSLLQIDESVELWIDSGGYQFLRNNIDISVEKLAKIYNSIEADYYISLDHPPSPRDRGEERRAKILKTIENYRKLYRLLDSNKKNKLLPVYHLSDSKLLEKQYNEYSRTDYAAVGGLIPYIMQLAGRNSRLKAVTFLSLVKKYSKQKIHALGIASPAMIPILRRLRIESADTMTWRHKAAYGKVIIPGMGERHVTGRKISFGPRYVTSNDWRKLLGYLEEFNKEIMAYNNHRIVVEDIKKSFEYRALFNAWSIISISVKNYDGEHIVSPSFKKLYNIARKYIEEHDRRTLLNLNDQLLGG